MGMEQMGQMDMCGPGMMGQMGPMGMGQMGPMGAMGQMRMMQMARMQRMRQMQMMQMSQMGQMGMPRRMGMGQPWMASGPPIGSDSDYAKATATNTSEAARSNPY